MPPESNNLFSLAQSKLQSVKNSSGLHRWVLLKNSIIRSQPLVDTNATQPDGKRGIDEEYEEDSETEEEEADSFLFPDAGKLVDGRMDSVSVSEAEWLDSLLESLSDHNSGDGDGVQVSVDDDDEDSLLWPLLSPMSSSDDLTSPSACFPPPIPLPVPLPYPPYQPISTSHIDPFLDSQISHPSDDHLPDIDDLSVPDAIEDTSDDESDTPSTPSLRNSASTQSSLIDPASVPLPRQRRPLPHVYVGMDSTYFYPFELDPLPFPEDDHHSYNPVYEEC